MRMHWWSLIYFYFECRKVDCGIYSVISRVRCVVFMLREPWICVENPKITKNRVYFDATAKSETMNFNSLIFPRIVYHLAIGFRPVVQ